MADNPDGRDHSARVASRRRGRREPCIHGRRTTVVVAGETIYRQAVEEIVSLHPRLSPPVTCDSLGEALGHLRESPDAMVFIEPSAVSDRGWPGDFRESVADAIVVLLDELTSPRDEAWLRRHGIAGFLTPEMTAEEANAMLTLCDSGYLPLADPPSPSRPASCVVRAAPGDLAPSHGVRELTAREAEVLSQISEGKSNKAIAKEFGISVHTVKSHVHNILSKLDVRSRASAVHVWRTNDGESDDPALLRE